jgi:hypothetical protein
MPRLAKPAFPTIGALRIVAGAALGVAVVLAVWFGLTVVRGL